MTGNLKNEYVATATDEVIFFEAIKRARNLLALDGGDLADGAFELCLKNHKFVSVCARHTHKFYDAPIYPRLVPA